MELRKNINGCTQSSAALKRILFVPILLPWPSAEAGKTDDGEKNGEQEEEGRD